MRFKDRFDAGQRLGERLRDYRAERPVVLALPRGGLPIGYEVAKALGAPLDIIVVRKLGAPQQPELAIGAVGPGGAMVLDGDLVQQLGVTQRQLEGIIDRERMEVTRRLREYRKGLAPLDVAGRVAILVDDGIATGSSVMAAIDVLRRTGPSKIVLATPVLPSDRVEPLRALVDDLVFLMTPTPFHAIGLWYEDFPQLKDAEVIDLLARARTEVTGETAATADSATDPEGGSEVEIELAGRRLAGFLELRARPLGLVIFAHGSGSGRFSPRNQFVAEHLRKAGLGTLLFDLLTRDEETSDQATGHLRFDVGMLATRLRAVARWAASLDRLAGLPIAYFGSSTGAAAALVAAAEQPEGIVAIVSRRGRPDLAGDALSHVRAPTLLIVGGDDEPVIGLNQQAYDRLACEKRLEIVPGATHLFEEPGKLETVADLASAWLVSHARHAAPAIR